MWTSLFVAVLVGCGGDSDIPECIDNGYCAEGQACVNDVCEDVECLSSAICDVGEYCNDKTYSCVDGCLENIDCVAGETCNTDTRSCEAYGCRDTTLDCPTGAECNLTTGECDSVATCQNCNLSQANSCRGGDVEAHCLPWDDLSEGWCFPVCDNSGGCPAGFSCYVDYPIDLFTYVDVCVADCPWLTETGHL
jgi:hypothetical protein